MEVTKRANGYPIAITCLMNVESECVSRAKICVSVGNIAYRLADISY